MAKKNIIATDQNAQELKKKVKTDNKGDVEQPKIYQTDIIRVMSSNQRFTKRT